MSHDQERYRRAISMRQQGSSLREISLSLGISKSTASLWVRDVRLSKEALARLARIREDGRRKAGRTHTRLRRERLHKAYVYAKNLLSSISISPDTARLICALLYWCEGAKLRPQRTFSFTNSDPQLVETFLRLLREGFAVEESRLRLNLHIHEYHDPAQELLFWSNLTKIPLSRCHKPYVKPHTGKRTRENYRGCVSIRYLDIALGREVEAIAKVFLGHPGP